MLNTNYAKLAGEQLAKYPFDDVAYTLWTGKPHCGGGSGGSKCAMGCDKCNYKLRIYGIKNEREGLHGSLYFGLSAA